jgi:hypothetical protein
LYGIYSVCVEVGVDGKSTSIEAFVDVENGRMTIIDNGEGITPDTLEKILNSSGINSCICSFQSPQAFEKNRCSLTLAHVFRRMLF